MDVNYLLKERKEQREKRQKIQKQKVERKFKAQKKYFDKELDDKIENDQMGDKKKLFYNEIFTQDQEEVKVKKTQKQPEIQQVKRKTNKEKKLVKKIFKERTNRGQPVMKNYLNYLVSKLEKERK